MSKAKKSTPVQFTSTYETVETNKVKITINISSDSFKEGLQKAYNKNKQYFDLPGFRKGKAPRMMIERMYGKDIFHEDAVNFILPDAYEKALEEHNLDPVYKPEEIEPGDMTEATGAVFHVFVYIRPEVTIDGYYGLTYPKMETEATQSDIQDMLTAEQEKNARQVSVDRPAELKDIVTINFTGYVDGEAFEGGAGEDFDLTLGSGQFIPGFEDQLVGCNVGDDAKVEVTFPEEYGHEALAGKPATFEVEILDIQTKELPEVDDDFAQDVSEFDNLADYKADLAKTITERKTSQLESSKRMHLAQQLSTLKVAEVPEAMYTARIDESWDNFTRQVEMRGMDVENYLRFSNMTEEIMRASWAEQAKFDVDSQLALEAVASKEGMTITDEEFSEHLKEMTGTEGDELAKLLENITPPRRRDIERDLLCKKALDLVAEHAIAVDEPLIPEGQPNIIEGEAEEVPEE
ncbi:MAG: trigger factor [Defluviitaleaceae bacterium]|nr:trigger factor [Defluviitaleaceae bacterium]